MEECEEQHLMTTLRTEVNLPRSIAYVQDVMQLLIGILHRQDGRILGSS